MHQQKIFDLYQKQYLRGSAAQFSRNSDFIKIEQRLLERYIHLWETTESTFPNLGQTYSESEKTDRDKHFDKFMKLLSEEIKSQSKKKMLSQQSRDRIFSAFEVFARNALDFEDRHFDIILSKGFTDASTAFVQQCHKFDSRLKEEEIFQAIRNVWAMNNLQALMGRKVELTPSILAYSLLYPYTDNFLDDPQTSKSDKEQFNDRLTERLTGKKITPNTSVEKSVYKLISIIEGQYNRSIYPQVFDSILAIHHAQIDSLQLLPQNSNSGKVDIERISIAKGGTSVLADGYLVAGDISEAEQDFMYGCGVLLQFMDDLRDVNDDCESGLQTIFSQAAKNTTLDKITNKTFNFCIDVMNSMDCFNTPDLQTQKELLLLSINFLLIEAVGRAKNFYSAEFINRIEPHFPFHYSHFRDQEKRRFQNDISMIKLIDAFSSKA